MSLQVWLPLTKDTRNQGLATGTINWTTTASFTNNGKLGKALTTGGCKMSASMTAQALNNQTVTIACWLFVNADADDSTNRAMIFGNDTMSTLGGRQFSIFRYPYSDDIHLSWQNCINGTYTTVIGGVWSGVLTPHAWNHICITYSNPTVKIYINGIQIGTASGSLNTDSYNFDTDIIHNSSSHYINDFRIYDHCLSPMEVKELAKGLVLHYPLNRQGWGQENLVKGSNTNSISTNLWLGHSAVGGNTSTIEQDETGTYCVKVTRDATAQSSWDYLSYDNFLRGEIKTDTTYTVSFDCKPSVSGSISFTGFVNGNATNYMTNSTTTIQGNCTANQWNHMVYQCKTISSFSGITVSGQVVYFSRSASLRGTNVTVLFKNIKVEEGSIATPWCPNSSDTLATTMGLNSTTEYDCSGFCNNGTKVGTLGWSSNTPKYNVSLDITTDSCARYIYGPAQTQLTDQITLACWLYQTSATATSGGNSTTNQFALSQGRDYLNLGFNIGVNNGKPGVYAGNGGSESGARVNLISTTKTITGSWHHVAATYNNGALKLYVDGQLDRETTVGTLDYVDAPALVVGKMAYGYTNATSYFPFIGYISDARVYATALTAAQIKELYETSMSIDNKGNIYTRELVEI